MEDEVAERFDPFTYDNHLWRQAFIAALTGTANGDVSDADATALARVAQRIADQAVRAVAFREL